ncbi:ASCH domain-containing protein [Planomicrobium sp. YIM 101495]|uniref:ASCH domain-containing protein n=1 Tax=Planomicrobium sp. YIM 101495 TaxID=2665160 RepID=UPI0012BA01B9|nr:ASCH domain-containing protein [Planomicrobium sp. YIM 101495]MTD29908.1 ASCH domain-containing protein [Planomicrobium sp. YIM 101495]
MIHHMGLYGEYFKPIKDGKKKIEVRLNDEKRRGIKAGDTIVFTKVPEQDETLEVEVTDLKTYPTFQEMYVDIPSEDFDCEGWTISEMVNGTYEIYTPEQEKAWGTLAIKMKV